MSKKSHQRYLLCLDNRGYEAALELRKLYVVVPDGEAKERGCVRVIDESGEDYLYSATRFFSLELPLAARRALAKAS
ncbi:MAG TPA: hypothetical protein VH253_16675 [Phycisphaerae bacterium]|nr:hypothetical protein [Phycisphaerae bacterium]